MSLSDLTLAAMLALAPVETIEAEGPHLNQLAGAIASAVDERDALDHWLPGSVIPLPSAPASTARALVAIAWHESAFRRSVSDCRIVGTDHPSITAFQLVGPWAWGGHSRRELCASPRLAAGQALYVLARQTARCRSIERGFWGYASGDCGRPTRAGRELVAIWRRLSRE